MSVNTSRLNPLVAICPGFQVSFWTDCCSFHRFLQQFQVRQRKDRSLTTPRNRAISTVSGGPGRIDRGREDNKNDYQPIASSLGTVQTGAPSLRLQGRAELAARRYLPPRVPRQATPRRHLPDRTLQSRGQVPRLKRRPHSQAQGAPAGV